MMNLTHLSDLDGLDAALAESHARPIVIFKHSRTCGISCEALEELQSHAAGSAAGAGYRIITVQSHRRLADEVTLRLGIRHETPQAILLRHGQPVWSASHFRVTAERLDESLASLADPSSSAAAESLHP